MIDGGCFVGRDLASGLEGPSDLAAWLDERGVEKALVASYRGLYQDDLAGAQEVAALAAHHPGRVVPVGVVNPAAYGAPPEERLRAMWALGIRVVAVSGAPAYYPPVWDSPAVRAVGEAAAHGGFVLQACLRTESDLAAVARAWSDLRVTVLVRWMAGHRYLTLASEAALAARWPRVLFDAGNMASCGQLAWAAKHLGSDRLFIASNAPHAVAECADAVLAAADLAPDQRRAVGAGNLARVLGLAPTRTREAASPRLGLQRWERLAVAPKVDVHWHPDSWNLHEPGLSDAEQTRIFDRFAVERVVASSVLALNSDLTAGNAALAAWCASEARRFGWIAVDARRGPESLGEIERWVAHPRFVGLKAIQDAAGLGLDDPAYEPLLARAAALHLPVLAHPPGLARASERHPDVQFVMAHGNWTVARDLVRLPNVSFDFASSHALAAEGQLARLAAAAPGRVVFGSDGPLVGPAWSVAKLQAARLEPAEEQSIIRDAAYRLLPRLSRSQEG